MKALLQQCLNKFEQLWEIGIDAEYKVDLLPEIHALRAELAKPQVDLTDEDIGDAYVAWNNTDGASFADFARLIEAQLRKKNG
jgi:hypothetical protein